MSATLPFIYPVKTGGGGRVSRWKVDLEENMRQFDRAAKTLGRDELDPLLQDIGDALVEFVREGFNQSRDPYGKRWKPLDSEYLANRSGLSNKPLIKTGRLRDSITYRVRGTDVELGTDVPYAKYHQGTDGIRNSVIPRRPFFPTDGDVPRRWLRTINELTEDFINDL